MKEFSQQRHMFLIIILRKYNDRYLFLKIFNIFLRVIDLKWLKFDIMNSIYLILKILRIKS